MPSAKFVVDLVMPFVPLGELIFVEEFKFAFGSFAVAFSSETDSITFCASGKNS
ncbi:MAG: hypothetical protein HC846_10340 [Blastocatellia bacterium]|nr:hypothetical protein [Blastocatellia bacterium]